MIIFAEKFAKMTVKRLKFGSRLRGTLTPPASKSLSNRALILAALTGGRVELRNLSEADDTRVLQAALLSHERTVDIGAAGTAMRFLTAYFAAAGSRGGQERLLTGSARMQQRPIGILVDALRSLGAHIDYAGAEGFPPLLIEGCELRGDALTMPANVSSQYISALLLIAPTLPRGLRLTLDGEVASRPYIDMTLGLLRRFGARADWTSPQTLEIMPEFLDGFAVFEVESDWSAASYWYEMMALSDDADACLRLRGLQADSLQGDCAVSRYFERLGVQTRFEEGAAVLTKTALPAADAPLKWDLAATPDLAQTLAVCCAALGRAFQLTGLRSLRIKETDRLAALQNELCKIGAKVEVVGDEALRFDGRLTGPVPNPSIRTYDDHRMAMAFAPAALRFPGLAIEEPQVVSKSYPRFWEDLEMFLE